MSNRNRRAVSVDARQFKIYAGRTGPTKLIAVAVGLKPILLYAQRPNSQLAFALARRHILAFMPGRHAASTGMRRA